MPPHERRRAATRRMLAAPSVCPCEAISPETLLVSLVALAADVAGRDAGAFPVLRRGAGEAVRVAGVLLAFLEEVREASSAATPLPGAAVLGLSELHVAMQKFRFLLADCARKGARLWVLMNAELVASELRVVLGSVATAMDVLPGDVIGASVEARELARLVSDQAWRAAVRPDAEDGRAARSVRSMLAQLKSGVTPDAEDARLVLGRVAIVCWWDCAEEVAFLEAELFERLEDGREDDNDLVLISGLMAFLLYCRVVLFDRTDYKKADAAAAAAPRPTSCATWTNLEALQCPITLELMTDPVTVATGQTYDRASINRWVKNGCRTCPVTGEKLRSAEVVPNVAVRGIIEQLLRSNGASLHEPSSKHRCAVDKTAAAFGPAAAGGVRLASAFLIRKLCRGTPEEQKKATYEVRKLAKRNVFHRACLVDAGAVPWLLHLLSSTDASVQDNAVASLLNLSKHPAGRSALVEAGGLSLIVDAVNVAVKVEAQENAAAILFYLSSNSEYCEEISRIPEAIPTLVHLMREGTYRGRKNALVSLYGVLHSSSNIGKAVFAGAVAVLAGLLSSDRDDLVNDSIALLARLAEQPAGAASVLASTALVTSLVDFLGASASRSGKDHCVALLASLCRHGGDRVVALMGKMPGLMPALYAIVADGGPQAGKKARGLINEIHRFYEQHQPTAVAPPAGDRVIRV